MKLKKMTMHSSSGKTFVHERYDFRVRPSPRDASVIFCAKGLMEAHYNKKLANSVFLGILCHYWVTGEKMVFEEPIAGVTTEELESL